MKFKVGDKVKYDSGEWWFYGTVNAVIENSISPCYRLSVERMEKKNCKFSITQFEFELEEDHEIESKKDKRKWEKSEIEYLKKYYGILNHEDLSKMLKRSYQEIEDEWLLIKSEKQPQKEPEKEPEKVKKQRKKPELKQEVETPETPMIIDQKRNISKAWIKNLESYQKGERSSSVFNWISQNRLLYRTGKLQDEKIEKLKKINFSFDKVRRKGTLLEQEKVEKPEKPKSKVQKRKITDAWNKNLESYQKGEKSNSVFNWISQNRLLYRTGKLQDEKIEKLMNINFSFDNPRRKEPVLKKEKVAKPETQKEEPQKRKRGDAWDLNLESYQKGDKSNIISTWIANNRREYKTGKLSEAKFEKLMAINFPFDIIRKKDDNWEKRLEEWKKGEKRSKEVQQWRQRSIKQYLEGRLSGDKIVKLKEIGILK